MKKFISILGSTGSVGLNTLKILDRKKEHFRPYIFCANKNYKLICKQIVKFKPVYFIVNDEKTFFKISKKFKKNKVKILNNYDKINFRFKSNLTISAIPGIAGLEPVLKFLKFSDKILLANKEAIICGWDLIRKQAKKYKTEIVPIDSEHYSILKLLDHHKKEEIKKIYITASGGPFLNYTINKLKKVTPSQALKHPKWKMGKKITIDSSTLMNKIFEVLEAQKIFNLPLKLIDILIHPNSLVHAILELKNGLKKFIYHETSMIVPLANAIFDGNLNIDNFYKDKNIGNEILVFKKVNKRMFPSINLLKVMNHYPSASIIINACNEVLVDQFLNKKIKFLDINRIIQSVLKDGNFKRNAVIKPINIKQIYQIDIWSRKVTFKKIEKL